MREIVSQARSRMTASAISHVSPRPVTGGAVQRARPPPGHKPVSSKVEREPGSLVIGNVRHCIKVLRATIEKFAPGSVTEVWIYQLNPQAGEQISIQDTCRFLE